MTAESTHLPQGLKLMVFGMGAVFLFLRLLVSGRSGLSAVLMRLAGTADIEPPSAESPCFVYPL